jgi:hypothetical protein
MSAEARTALLEGILHAKKLRAGIDGMAGCIALDAIADALVALRRGADEIAEACDALEGIADQLHDLASDVAGYYREPELTDLDHARNRADARSKAMRENAA